MNRPSLTLVRKPPLELSKRFAGRLLLAMIAWIFVRPTVERMLHPVSGEITSGESPLPQGDGAVGHAGVRTLSSSIWLFTAHASREVGRADVYCRQKQARGQNHASALDVRSPNGRHPVLTLVLAPDG